MKYTALNILVSAFVANTAVAQIESKLDKAFSGFEKRFIAKNDSGVFVYTSTPSSVCQEGGANISGLKIMVKNNAINSVSPLIKKKQSPGLDLIYSKAIKGVSLSKVLTECGFEDLDSSQIYFVIFSWCQASVIFCKGDVDLDLSISQKSRIKKECGIQELKDLVNFEEKGNYDRNQKLKLLTDFLKNPM